MEDMVLVVSEGSPLTPLRKMIALMKTMTPVKRTTTDLGESVLLTMTTTMTMTTTITMTMTAGVLERLVDVVS